MFKMEIKLHLSLIVGCVPQHDFIQIISMHHIHPKAIKVEQIEIPYICDLGNLAS